MSTIGKMILVNGMSKEDFEMMKDCMGVEDCDYENELKSTDISEKFRTYWMDRYAGHREFNEDQPNTIIFRNLVRFFIDNNEGTVEEFAEWTAVPSQTLVRWIREDHISNLCDCESCKPKRAKLE